MAQQVLKRMDPLASAIFGAKLFERVDVALWVRRTGALWRLELNVRPLDALEQEVLKDDLVGYRLELALSEAEGLSPDAYDSHVDQIDKGIVADRRSHFAAIGQNLVEIVEDLRFLKFVGLQSHVTLPPTLTCSKM